MAQAFRVFVHTNAKQYLGAVVAAYSMQRRSRTPEAFRVEIIKLGDFPWFERYQGRPYLRGGTWQPWLNEDLQSFTPLRFALPERMGYQGRALVVDPDVFAVGDVWELLSRDMGGKAILCRTHTGIKRAVRGRYASSVMLLDCKALRHWRLERQFDELFSGARDYRTWLGLEYEDPHDWYQLCQLGVCGLSFWGHALGGRRWFHPWITALLLNLMLGALAYLLIPAIGPFLYESGPNRMALQAEQVMAQVAKHVGEQGAQWLSLYGSEFFTSAPAAMPSLHVSIACIASYYAIRARLKLRFLILLMAAWIPLEAVVARWHYLADVPAGMVFAGLVIALSNRLCRRPGVALPVREPPVASRVLQR